MERLNNAKSTSLRILVVDDNMDAADSVAALLRLDGHSVDVVYTGEDALRRVDHNKFDLAVLDLSLPNKDGFEVARHIRGRRGPRVQMLALTGSDSGEARTSAAAAGFDAFCVKGSGYGLLHSAIEAAMANRLSV